MSPLKKLVTGTALISSVNALRLAVQLVSLPLLARLLNPEDYGVVAMAMPILLFVMLFADSGLGVSLVREKTADMTAWHSCFWLTAGLGAGLSFALAALAPSFAHWMAEPTLAAVMASLASVIMLQSLTLVPGAAMQQQAMFSRIAIAEIIAILLSVGVAITAALNGLGVWALVWQQIVMYAVRLVLTALLGPYRPRLVFAWQAARGHVVFGWTLLAANAIGFGGRSVESIMIGKFRGAADLGIYGMAFQFARLPWMIVTGPLQFVLYPLVAGAHSDVAKLRAQALLASKVLATLLLAPMALIGAAGVPIFDLLLSEKWRDAAYIFALIIPAMAVQPVTGVLGTFILAIGRPEIQLRLTMQSTILWMACLFSAVWVDLTTVAIAYTVSTLVFSVWSLKVMLPLLGCSLKDYAKAVGGQAILAVVMAGTYWAITQIWALGDVFAILLAVVLACGCVGISLLLARRDLTASLRALR
jgi:O-antigen/teichoic acid export membrane protein